MYHWDTVPYLGPGLDLLFTDETLLDARRTQRAGSDVAARPEQRVPLHIRAHHTLLQGLVVAVQRRAAGAHLATERHGEGEEKKKNDVRKKGRVSRQGRRGKKEKKKSNKRWMGWKENMTGCEDGWQQEGTEDGEGAEEKKSDGGKMYACKSDMGARHRVRWGYINKAHKLLVVY